MRLRVDLDGQPVDVTVSVPDPTTRVSEIVTAVTGNPAPATVAVDGQEVRTSEPIGAIPIRNGSLINRTLRQHAARGADVVVIAGPSTGERRTLPPGTYDIGPTDPDTGQVRTPEFRVSVDDNGTPTIDPFAGVPIRVNDITSADPAAEGWDVTTPTSVYRIRRAEHRPRRRLPTGRNGRLVFLRPPRLAAVPAVPPPPPPSPPNRPREAQPLSWAMILAPIPVGIVMAILFNPFFLAFTAMTPVMTLGRWYESRYRSRKDAVRYAEQRAAAGADYGEALAAHQSREAGTRRALPDLDSIRRRTASGEPSLWHRRPGHDDFLSVTVAYGRQPSVLTVGHSTMPEVARAVVEHSSLIDVPIQIDLEAHPGVVLTGEPGPARSTAAAMISELAAHHGPADLELALLATDDRLGSWDWMKWLPHVADGVGGYRVVTEPGALNAILPNDDAPTTTTVRLVVVDGDFGADLMPLAAAANRGEVRAMVLAGTATDAPAFCSVIVEVGGGPEGRVCITDVTVPSQIDDARPVLPSPAIVEEIARNLGAFEDPEQATGATDLPRRVRLRDLQPKSFDPDDLRNAWATPPAGLRAALGVDDAGVWEVDLVGDGPHALVAGTTGAGKSELLRSMVASLAGRYSPTAVNFVLIDFKGGGAFDVCADLPHTVGVVTDLDEHLARRALRCLRAELRFRETALRDRGVSDIRDLGPGELPRLVLVVDEFATLAAELPDFMSSLVDIAQRGRSLGIHMVLATQRPSGVVDAKIRANTNLRICLRVQSEADSFDVIGGPAASTIDRRTPGRAFARLGAGELVAFQSALVSAPSARDTTTGVIVQPFRLASALPAATEEAAPDPDDGVPELAILSGAAQSASGALALDAPRVPWPDPMPTVVPAASFAVSERIPWGLVDLPDAQRVDERTWSPEDGNLFVYGVDWGATAAVVSTLAQGLIRTTEPAETELYLIDFGPGATLAPLSGLPHVAGYVPANDEELLERAIRRLEQVIDDRRRTSRAAAAKDRSTVFVGLTGFGGLLAFADESGQLDLSARLERIVADGAELGVVIAATANHERGIPSRIASQVETKLVMRLADPNAYTAFGLRTRDVPELDGTRGLLLPSREAFQLATYADLPEADGDATAVGRLETLAEHIPVATIAGASWRDDTTWHLAFGRRHTDLAPSILSASPGVHAIVAGGPGSGKTNTLKVMARATRSADPTIAVHVLGGRPADWAGCGGVIHDALPMPNTPALVLIDGLRATEAVDQPTLDRLLATGDMRCIVADRPDRFRMPPQWARAVLASRTGILLQPLPDHGDVLRTRLPMRRPAAFPPGRGFFIDAGFTELVQVAVTTESLEESASDPEPNGSLAP